MVLIVYQVCINSSPIGLEIMLRRYHLYMGGLISWYRAHEGPLLTHCITVE